MTKYETPELLHVKWVDSANLFQDRWARLEDLDGHDVETFCETVGWLVAENASSLFVAGSLSPEEIGSVMQIPRVAVVERRRVVLDVLVLPEASEANARMFAHP